MPAISKIRFTNVIYEDGQKRYNDDTFYFEGENGAIVLENGGGKTVFIQTALQAILPHTDVAGRKIKETLSFEEGPAHIAIEWILSERPRRYALTAVTLFQGSDKLESYRFVDEYREGDKHSLMNLPFVRDDGKRPAEKGEMLDYYRRRTEESGKLFDSISAFKAYIETNYHIIASEWESIVKINSTEGGIEAFFDECKTSRQLFERLLIPAVESTLASNEEETFVDTFSEQRKAFKEYQRFQETVRENRLIEDKLHEYVEQFSHVHKTTQRYDDEKKRAKAYTEYHEQQLQVNEEEAVEIQQAFTDLAEKQRDYKKKELSYDIAVKRDRLTDAEQKLNAQRSELLFSQEQLQSIQQQYGSLKAASLRQTIEEANGTVTALRNELKAHDQSYDLEQLTEELETNARKLKGYFMTLKEQLENKERELQRDEESSKEQLAEEQMQLKKLENEYYELNGDCKALESNINLFEEQMAEIEKELLASQEQESMTDYIQKWTRKMVQLDESIVQLKTANNHLRSELEQLTESRDRLYNERSETERRRATLENEKKHIDSEHEQLKVEVKLLLPKWQLLDTLYMKEESILGNFHNEISKIEEKRSDLLQKERIAYRYVDDYEEMATFFADRFLYENIQTWKNQFSYVVTGAEFLQQLSLERVPSHYPYWGISVITTADEKAKLMQKVNEQASQLQYPVIVLSNDEAHQLLKEEQWTELDHLTPHHWNENIDDGNFRHWKAQLKQQAELVRDEREEVEKTHQHWQRIEQRLKDFFTQYPFDLYAEINHDLDELARKEEDLERQLNEVSTNEKRIQKQLKNQEEQISTDESTLKDIEKQLQKAHEYINTAKKRDKLNHQLEAKKVKKTTIDQRREKQEKIVERAEAHVEACKDALRKHQYEMQRRIKYDDLYHETKAVSEPLFTETSYYALREERNSIRRQLDQVSSERRLIEQQIQVELDQIEKAERELVEVKQEYPDIDETLEFPANGNEQMSALIVKRRECEREVKKLAEAEKKANEHFIKHETLVTEAEREFLKQFSEEEIMTFSLPLPSVHQELEVEKQRLEKREQQLNNREKRNQEEHAQLKKLLHDYEVLNGKHEFLSPYIEAEALSEEIRTELLYKAKTFFKETKARLDEMDDDVQILKEKLDRTKGSFKNFCHREIKNSKLRDRTIQGLDHHTTYERLIEFQAKMDETITRAIQFAEKSMKDTDKDLEQFIHRMYTHIEMIVSELHTIPNKTRVNVEGTWKTIYKFSIPEWEENEAKQALRSYVQSLVNRLDSEHFKDASGREDVTKVRKEVEQSLHSRQLLNIMTKQQKLTVLCRKVTNDNSVTSRRYVWETTNNWSGGEKWSKNMTLFLGLLNYIAEKRQDIRPHSKRHRTVIVDNPFGKASSDHVLQPVFFIAEQLGFQIIALTAHMEGKFLRDYFPIIYSCRLRQAVNSTKQIIEKEKQISAAYFQDHNPDALERLGEREQLELFALE